MEVVPGVKLKDALSRALNLRKLNTLMCGVYTNLDTSHSISWDTNIADLNTQEVYVKVLDKNQQKTFISHYFVRKTYFSLAFCEACRRLLFTGFYCNQCNFRFHQRCASKVPPLCNQIDYYEKLLTNPEHIAGILNPGKAAYTRHPRQMSPSDRANSAPNVCVNNVKQPHDGQKTLAPPKITNLFQRSHNNNNEYPHSTDASPTNSLKPKRKRARSADESNKNLLNPKQNKGPEDHWNIPAEEILIGARIGSGSFGTVYKAHWHGPVAVKTLNVKTPSPAQLQAFKNEVAMLKKTRHSNILLFMGCVSTPSLAIVTQWCEGSSLYKHIHVNDTKFRLITLIDIGRQIAQGMDYLHAKNIIHRWVYLTFF